MSLTVQRSDDEAGLVEAVAQAFCDTLRRVQGEGRVPSVVLTGGRIADTIHRAVADRAARVEVDWSRVDWWWGDERFVAADSPDRNEGQVRRALLDHVGVDPDRVHAMPSPDGGLDLEDAARAHGQELLEFGPVRFDLTMLGLGPDGHVASLFPGHPALDRIGLVAGVVDSPKPPPERITFTVPTLNRSARTWLLASGPEKAAAVQALLSPAGSVSATPARALRSHDELVLWTDLP